jgi:hypothetical protein
MSDFFGKKEYPKLKGFADDLRLWFLSTSFWAANASSFTHIDWRKNTPFRSAIGHSTAFLCA